MPLSCWSLPPVDRLGDRPGVAITCGRNEPLVRVRSWVEHYRREGFQPIYIDTNTPRPGQAATRRVVEEAGGWFVPIPHRTPQRQRVRHAAGDMLLAFCLEFVDFAVIGDVDEFCAPDPEIWGQQTLAEVLSKDQDWKVIAAIGYEPIHRVDQEPALDWTKRPYLAQRSIWLRTPVYDKPIITRVPLVWPVGRHCVFPRYRRLAVSRPDIVLVHLKQIDLHTYVFAHRALQLAIREFETREGCPIRYSVRNRLPIGMVRRLLEVLPPPKAVPVGTSHPLWRRPLARVAEPIPEAWRRRL